MRFDILTLFPEMFESPFQYSIIKRAKEKDLVRINIYNIRDWSVNKHKTAIMMEMDFEKAFIRIPLEELE